ncbi:hypothetical protein LY78DRAFT_661180 [Colletotrichum sublineola]|nr:hypothetical protein LY78DRAFT_661180 [Colletotrichum sublineola]
MPPDEKCSSSVTFVGVQSSWKQRVRYWSSCLRGRRRRPFTSSPSWSRRLYVSSAWFSSLRGNEIANWMAWWSGGDSPRPLEAEDDRDLEPTSNMDGHRGVVTCAD